MIDPRRVYIVCAKIQAPLLFRYNSLIAHESKDSGHGRWDDDDDPQRKELIDPGTYIHIPLIRMIELEDRNRCCTCGGCQHRAVGYSSGHRERIQHRNLDWQVVLGFSQDTRSEVPAALGIFTKNGG